MSETLRYELWDVESGNQVEICQTEQDAVDAVRELLVLNGEGSIRAMMLGVIRREPSGTVKMFPLLDGDELLKRALGVEAVPRGAVEALDVRAPRSFASVDPGTAR